MSHGYRLTSEAQANIDDICGFIAEDNVDAAVRVLEALEHAFERLADTPEIGHKREDLTTRPVRFWIVYSYLVVCDPVSTPLTIIAVLHGARDVEAVAEGERTVMSATAPPGLAAPAEKLLTEP